MPDASVKSSKSWASVVPGSRNAAVPFQDGRNECHHKMSALASLVSLRWWWRHLTFVLRVINLRRKRRPAGTALAAKASLPMSESSALLVVFLRWSQCVNSMTISSSFAFGSLICLRIESSSKPRKISVVAGPSTLSIATGKPSSLHTLRKHCR